MKLKQKLYLAGGLIIIVAVIATILIINNRTEAQTPEANTSSQGEPKTISLFSFDSSNAGGWTKGPSNESSLAVFSPDRSCFLSVERKSGVVNATTAIQNIKSNLTRDGYTVNDAGEGTASMQTSFGAKRYTLQQLSVTGSGRAGGVYGGQSYGYVPLENGYLSVFVNCGTVDQLVSAATALNAISYSLEK